MLEQAEQHYEKEKAVEIAGTIPFFDSYDLATGKLSLRAATHFPMEIFDFAKQYPLHILNASGSELSLLPKEFGQLNRLQIALFSDNKFEEVPRALSECPELSIIALKSNKISTWGENALPLKTRWLMLTGNAIEKIPPSIGTLRYLQKLALAGNRIASLPEEMALCRELELIRIAANELQEPPPDWVLNHSKFTWYGDSGNPFCSTESKKPKIGEIKLEDIAFDEKNDLVGESPSSRVFRGSLLKTGEKVAVKIFKSGLTSDGFPEDDMRASIAAGTHQGLIKIIAKLSGHPMGSEGIVLSLVPPEYKKLGHPPDFTTCTRDTFPSGTSFSVDYILNVFRDISSACEHLHRRGIAHGDIYAHNILSNSAGHSLLGDFGAASFYEPSTNPAREYFDVRAFGFLMADLLEKCIDVRNEKKLKRLAELQRACLSENLLERPRFSHICQVLSKI